MFSCWWPLHPGCGQPYGAFRVLAKAALADHRVLRVVVQVQHRAVVQVDAQRGQATRQRSAYVVRQRLVAHRAQRHGRRRLRQEQRAHHGAAFLVDADQHVVAAGFAQLGHQRTGLGRVLHIAAEQADGADMVVTQKGLFCFAQGGAGHIYHQGTAGQAAQVLAHFTAPSKPRRK